jgi:hypothetical protein
VAGGVAVQGVLDTINSTTLCKVMPPPGTTLWLLRNFGEEQPIMPEKAHNPLSAAGARRQRPYKTPEINISLSAFTTNEQYHQMCGRTNTMPPLNFLPSGGLKRIICAEGVLGEFEVA